MHPIAIACGDHAGVGPEVTLKALANRPHPPGNKTRFVLVGDRALLEQSRNQLALDLPWSALDPSRPLGDQGIPEEILLLDVPLTGAPPSPGIPSADTALHALSCLQTAAQTCLAGTCAGLVTAPVSKESILRAGVPFVGQTEYLAQLAGSPEVTMMLLGDDDQGRWLRVALVTTHLPLQDVPAAVSQRSVLRAIRHTNQACQQLGLDRHRIGVAGLNPHAGEGGLLGNEETTQIQPAIQSARGEGIEVSGPIPGDTLFHQALHGAFDAVVAMYHDQGLAPLKLIAFDRGVNWSLALPFIRTSPDHGTAFDIAGRGIANPSSMTAAIHLATTLAAPRT